MACYVLKFDGVAEEIRIPSSLNEEIFNWDDFTKDLFNYLEKEQVQITLKSEHPITELSKETTIFYSTQSSKSLWFNLAKTYGFNTKFLHTIDYNQLPILEKNKIDIEFNKLNIPINNLSE